MADKIIQFKRIRDKESEATLAYLVYYEIDGEDGQVLVWDTGIQAHQMVSPEDENEALDLANQQAKYFKESLQPDKRKESFVEDIEALRIEVDLSDKPPEPEPDPKPEVKQPEV